MEPSNKNKLLEAIIARAWRDESFKKELLLNPDKAIEDFTGRSVNLPIGRKIIVHDQSDPTAIYITIPINEKELDIELSEDELNVASGGTADDGFDWLRGKGN